MKTPLLVRYVPAVAGSPGWMTVDQARREYEREHSSATVAMLAPKHAPRIEVWDTGTKKTMCYGSGRPVVEVVETRSNGDLVASCEKCGYYAPVWKIPARTFLDPPTFRLAQHKKVTL